MDPRGIRPPEHEDGLPRSRGDGPQAGQRADWIGAAAPLTRGWPLLRLDLGAGQHGCPAHAGMDPVTAAASSRRTGLPRSRGDGPMNEAGPCSTPPAAPLTRGWTRLRGHFGDVAKGCPAHAGMDPGDGRWCSDEGRLPRSRGDGPLPEFKAVALSAAAPLTRGWTLVLDLGLAHRHGCPAHAGMDPLHSAPRLAPLWLPRSRGDGPGGGSLVPAANKAAPLTRGWTPRGMARQQRARGCPAHAGMDPVAAYQ